MLFVCPCNYYKKKWKKNKNKKGGEANSYGAWLTARVSLVVLSISVLGRRARMANIDLKLAFRMDPVRKEDLQFLGIKWRGRFYVDTCLPFGLHSAPLLFKQFANVLEWILWNNYRLHWPIHYLDDYFLTGISRCQFIHFFLLAPQEDPMPTAMPGIVSTIWMLA